MTRDDVIRLAREAGAAPASPFLGIRPADLEAIERFAHLVIADFLQRTGQYVTNDASREAALDLARGEEREACASVRLPVTAFDFRQKILKGELNAKYDEGFLDGVRAMRAAIRARGQK